VIGNNKIAELVAWVPIYPGNNPISDIAVAKITSNKINMFGDIMNIGKIKSVTGITSIIPTIGTLVMKNGRTSGLTKSSIFMTNTMVNVNYSSCYGENFTVQLNNCAIISSPNESFSKPGDSGSLIVTDEHTPNPIAIIFAGNSQYTISLPIGDVLKTIDDLLGKNHGTTKIIGNISAQSVIDPISPLELNENSSHEKAKSVMIDNHDFLMNIPNAIACGIGINECDFNITIICLGEETENIPQVLDGVKIIPISTDSPFISL
jgi:hypothetical protein